MHKNLKDFIKISKDIGVDPSLVQGGGGNTSVKCDEKKMYVKASGVALKDVNAERGYRLVDLAQCNYILSDEDLAGLPAARREQEIATILETCCVDRMHGRPSVETNLHALLGRCVAHTHPSSINALLCAEDADVLLAGLYGEMQPPYLLLEYVDFGYPLALKMKNAIETYRAEHGTAPAVTFLKNHGLFVSAENPEEVLSITRKLVERAKRKLEESAQSSARRNMPEIDDQKRDELIFNAAAELRNIYRGKLRSPVLVSLDRGEEVEDFMRSKEPGKLAETPALVPDQQLYCNGAPVWVEFRAEADALRGAVQKAVERVDDGPTTPVCILIDGLGMFTAGAGKKLLDSARATMLATLTVLSGAGRLSSPRPLPEDSLRYIKESEWEKYRHSLLDTREGGYSGLSGKAAVISGAGSGLGRGISIGLAREGMHVVLVDVDTEGMEETARRIRRLEAPDAGSASSLQVDVTSENQVMELYGEVIKQLGGIDLLVNCASVAPPLPLLEFPVEAFRKANDINLTGYMLMAREAAKVMRRQGTGGSIINLSSKSALEPSKNHSAYNATKAGELHMARGWALELAEYGIRVNSVCPGNVFHESKIWNEDYIRALGEKRGLQPEEVIPHYINMTALKQEIGWDDITDAIVFLAGDRAGKITGQTLVVDAGQVFVR